jgi:hypothetical protein
VTQRDRVRRAPARLAISVNNRNVPLTAAAFGNRSATSGAMTTTFELVRSRSEYFLQANATKSERPYSPRSSSATVVLAFLARRAVMIPKRCHLERVRPRVPLTILSATALTTTDQPLGPKRSGMYRRRRGLPFGACDPRYLNAHSRQAAQPSALNRQDRIKRRTCPPPFHIREARRSQQPLILAQAALHALRHH